MLKMFIFAALDEPLTLHLLKEDASHVQLGGREYRDIFKWGDQNFLGFYDWLRNAERAILGVSLILHDGRELLSQVIPPRKYIEWDSEYVFEVRFREGNVDRDISADQEFSVSRCLVAENSHIALIFDASALSEAQLRDLLGNKSL